MRGFRPGPPAPGAGSALAVHCAFRSAACVSRRLYVTRRESRATGIAQPPPMAPTPTPIARRAILKRLPPGRRRYGEKPQVINALSKAIRRRADVGSR